MRDEEPHRAFVKMDRFAFGDFARKHRLSPATRQLLNAIVLAADPRTHEFITTYTEMAEMSGAGRKSVPSMIWRLEDSSAILVLDPGFGQNRSAVVRVLIYDELVVREKKRAKGSAIAADDGDSARDGDESDSDRVAFASDSRPNRVVFASSDAKTLGVSSDGGSRRGSEAVRSGRSLGGVDRSVVGGAVGATTTLGAAAQIASDDAIRGACPDCGDWAGRGEPPGPEWEWCKCSF